MNIIDVPFIEHYMPMFGSYVGESLLIGLLFSVIAALAYFIVMDLTIPIGGKRDKENYYVVGTILVTVGLLTSFIVGSVNEHQRNVDQKMEQCSAIATSYNLSIDNCYDLNIPAEKPGSNFQKFGTTTITAQLNDVYFSQDATLVWTGEAFRLYANQSVSPTVFSPIDTPGPLAPIERS